MWQRLYTKWKDLRSREQGKKLDFASAALILLQKKKKKRLVLQFYFLENMNLDDRQTFMRLKEFLIIFSGNITWFKLLRLEFNVLSKNYSI